MKRPQPFHVKSGKLGSPTQGMARVGQVGEVNQLVDHLVPVCKSVRLQVTRKIYEIPKKSWPLYWTISETRAEYPRESCFGYRLASPNEQKMIQHPIIFGQQSTSRSKPNTLLAGKHSTPDVVLKGPYSPDKPGLLRKLQRTYEMCRDLFFFGDRSFVPWEIIQFGKDFYLSSPNVGRLPEKVVWGPVNQWEQLMGWKPSRDGKTSLRTLDQFKEFENLIYCNRSLG